MLNNGEIKNIFTIAMYTSKEILKSKILINTLLIGVGLFIATYVAYNFTYGEPARVSLDFGLGTLSLSSVGIALFIGVGILSDEIKNRTVYLVISRPVTRSSFILGKILGLFFVLLINIFILSLITMSLYFFTGGSYQELITWTVVFIGLEATLVMVITSMFSLVSTKVLSVILSIVVYILGHSIDGAKLTYFVKSRPTLEAFLDVYQFVLPAFHRLNLKSYLLYEQDISVSYLLNSFAYGFIYTLSVVLFSIMIFNKKNLD